MPTIHNILKTALSPSATAVDRQRLLLPPDARERGEALTLYCDAIAHRTRTVEASAAFSDLDGVVTPELHLPCLTPKYGQLWIEGAIQGRRLGALVYRHDLREWHADNDTYRFLCPVFVFVDAGSAGVGCVGGVRLFLKPDGSLWFGQSTFWKSMREQVFRELAEIAMGGIAHALCKMHCQNVEVTKVGPGEQWLKEERPVKRMSEWHTLRVRPLRRSSVEVRDAGVPKITRLMSRAGHYGDYRQSGLFGRHRGIYWFSECQYGDAEFGEVVPEYALV